MIEIEPEDVANAIAILLSAGFPPEIMAAGVDWIAGMDVEMTECEPEVLH